jgi:hypothetical protein
MEVGYHHSLFSLDMCFCFHLAVHEGKQETSVGEKHDDKKMRYDRKSHEIQKGTTKGPHMMKRAPNRAWARLPDPSTRLTDPS